MLQLQLFALVTANGGSSQQLGLHLLSHWLVSLERILFQS